MAWPRSTAPPTGRCCARCGRGCAKRAGAAEPGVAQRGQVDELTARSLLGIRDVDPGFDARAVSRISFSPPRGATEEEIGSWRHQLADALRGRPEIDSVALEGRLPAELLENHGQPFETRDGPSGLAFYNLGSPVTHEYFDLMGLTLVRGRGFTPTEGDEDANVAVISEEAANRLWAGESRVLGRELRFPGSDRWLTVVGVVSDIVRVANRRPGERTGNRLAAEPWPDIYLPAAGAEPTWRSTLLVRPLAAEVDLARVLDETARSVNPDIPVEHRTLWEASYETHAMVFAVLNRLLALFGLSILVVSALGIYGVLAHVSTLRTREYGIRLALGATRRDVLSSVLWHGQRLALLGLATGAVASYAVYRLAGNFLFGVGPDDPTTYAVVGFTILLVAAIGSLVPARRATATDPVDALRAQ